MNWKKIAGVILLIPSSVFCLLILGSLLYQLIGGIIDGYPDSVYVLLFFMFLAGCTLSGINLFNSKKKPVKKKGKGKKTKKRVPAKRKNLKNYFIMIGFIVIFSLSLFNFVNFYTLTNNGNDFKQVENRLFEDSLQKVKGIIIFDANSSVAGKEINYSVVNVENVDKLDKEINSLQQERDNLVIEIRESLDSVFSESIAYSMEKSRGVKLNTEMDFNELYSYYISIFHQRYDENLDKLYDYNEHIQTVPELIQNNYVGDCDDYALFLYNLACKKGLQVQYAFGHKDETSLGGHAWIQIKQNGIWMDYDSTSNRICVDCITNDFPYLNVIGGDC